MTSAADSSGLLGSLSHKSSDHEFYTPVPKGYEAGTTKYLVITGSVISGVGKGIFSASTGALLETCGLKIEPIKFDGYLNQDAGTLNPYRHGEVFVLDDGAETDMDLGTYERFLDKNLSRQNYLTGGKIFNTVLSKERRGDYLGRDVQFIPHVTGEIKNFVRELALNTKADMVIIEVGGTVGDLESGYFLEAMRQLQYEEGRSNVAFANVTYAFMPTSLGEQKSKPAQIGVRMLQSAGIQPDIVVVRAANEVSEKVREKISIYSNVPFERVINLPDAASVYAVPGMLKAAGVDKVLMELLGLHKHPAAKGVPDPHKWVEFAKSLSSPEKTVRVGITGKYTEVKDSYASVLHAIEHARAHAGCKVEVTWIETSRFEKGSAKDVEEALAGLDGIIVPGGFGARGTEGKIACINYARTHKLPYLGLCYGMQMAVVEFCRNVLGIAGANSTEIDGSTADPVIDILPEQKKIEGLGGNMRLGGRDVELLEESQAWELYGKKKVIRERFRHRYEVNPTYLDRIAAKGMVFSGKAPGHPIMQVMELPGHPFFMGAQYHPELTSRPFHPSPLFLGFMQACVERK
jgi:CTP synthase